MMDGDTKELATKAYDRALDSLEEFKSEQLWADIKATLSGVAQIIFGAGASTLIVHSLLLYYNLLSFRITYHHITGNLPSLVTSILL